MFNIYRFISKYHNSNTFIIDFMNEGVVIIDPGDPNPTEVVRWLVENRRIIDTVILTHEHADHCIGVDYLNKFYTLTLMCSNTCARNIKDPKQNLSFYIDEIPTFRIELNPIIVQDNQRIDIMGKTFLFQEIPGHSPGSMLIVLDTFAFTGDSLLKSIKTPLSFPHSSKAAYKLSYEKIIRAVNGKIIYPGHGDVFLL